MSSGYDAQDVDDFDDALDDDPDRGPDSWGSGFSRGWTAAQNAVPSCCLHGEDCPQRRPQGSRVGAWLRRVLS